MPSDPRARTTRVHAQCDVRAHARAHRRALGAHSTYPDAQTALHPPAASGPRRLYHPSTLRMSDPILAYSAESEVNQLQWSKTQPDWVAIAFDKKLQILRV